MAMIHTLYYSYMLPSRITFMMITDCSITSTLDSVRSLLSITNDGDKLLQIKLTKNVRIIRT